MIDSIYHTTLKLFISQDFGMMMMMTSTMTMMITNPDSNKNAEISVTNLPIVCHGVPDSHFSKLT